MKNRLNYCLLILLMLPFVGWDQLYNFRNYTVKDGVAQSQVYSIIQDSRGFIWLGTRGGGITRFDGENFKTFSVKEGLVNNYIYKIKEDCKKNLWFATNNGITYYNGIKFKTFSAKNLDFELAVHDLVEEAENKFWLATNNGIYLFSNGKFTNISAQLNLEKTVVNTVLIDHKHHIWFGSEKGLFEITKIKKKYRVKSYSNYKYMHNSITSIREDSKGNLWIGTYGDGAYKFDRKTFSRFDLKQELYKQTILDIYIDEQANYWFATLNKGVVQYNLTNKNFNWLSENEGLSNNHVRSICKDNSGSFWFGTSGGGACNYFGKKFTTYDKNSGLGGNFIYSIYKDSRGILWVGNSQKGVSALSGNIFTQFNASNGFLDVKVKAIGEDNSGRIYFGTDGQGVLCYDGTGFKEIEELKKKYIRAIRKDDEGNLWFATAGTGLYELKFNDDQIEVKHFTSNEGLLHDRLTSLWIDKRGRIWYGTESNGIGYIQNEEVQSQFLRSKDGLSSNAIRSLVEDKNGNLWIGTAGYGVSMFYLYDNHFMINSFDHSNGLTSSNIYLLTIDSKNNLIAGSETGLDYLTLNSNRKISSIKHFGKGDGFTGIETCQNAVFNDLDGTIWFGTINGLSKFNPSNSSINKNEPITTITDVKLFYESISKTKYKTLVTDWNQVSELDLPFNQNHISFDFKAINLSNPEGVKYKWKLIGFDEDWSPNSKEHSILYSNLFPGDYIFLVKACNEDGIWNKKAIQIKIHIATPFWLQKWVIVSVISSLLFFLFLIYKWQIKRIKKKSFEEKRKLQMEKDFLELEQKALRLQMNPHFIFNALNSIQSLIGGGKEQEARYYLAKFSRLMRQILDNSRNATITLEEEANTLENYLMIEKFCNGDRFDYQITIAANIEKDFVKIPPMLLQPFVENAIKHGLKFSDSENTRRGMIKINFEEKNALLTCTISDNGIGRSKAEEMNEMSKETYHQSTALIVIQERLEILKENKNFDALEIIDLKDTYGNALGTKVIVRIMLTST
ncbi:MAG: histidine kinase [Flavobacteriia bacterium]|nr:histidine kinase [Flavobacteriia bacterium]